MTKLAKNQEKQAKKLTTKELKIYFLKTQTAEIVGNSAVKLAIKNVSKTNNRGETVMN